MSRSSGVGELLVRAGLIDASGLSRAAEIQSKGEVSLGRALADLGLANENAVCATIAEALRLECLGAELPDIAPEMEALLPMKFCLKHFVVPLNLKGNALRLGMADPLDYPTIQDVMFRSSKDVVPVVASQTSIVTLLNKFPSEAVEAEETYESLTGAVAEGEVVAMGDAEETVDTAKLAKDTKLAPIIRLVNLVLSGAAKAGASDIHVEPKEKALLVRQRVDGLLHDVFRIPKHLQDATISVSRLFPGWISRTAAALRTAGASCDLMGSELIYAFLLCPRNTEKRWSSASSIRNGRT